MVGALEDHCNERQRDPNINHSLLPKEIFARQQKYEENNLFLFSLTCLASRSFFVGEEVGL